jgi:hypothetical protein
MRPKSIRIRIRDAAFNSAATRMTLSKPSCSARRSAPSRLTSSACWWTRPASPYSRTRVATSPPQSSPFSSGGKYVWTRGGSFSQKIESANPAQLSQKGQPQIFHHALWNQLWVSRLCTPAYRGLKVHDSRPRQNQILISYTLVSLA